MRYEATVQVKPDVLKEMNRILDLDVGLEDTKDGNTIQTFYADFYNGYQADIKVCNGSRDSSPWIDAVLFDKDGGVANMKPTNGDRKKQIQIVKDTKGEIDVIQTLGLQQVGQL